MRKVLLSLTIAAVTGLAPPAQAQVSVPRTVNQTALFATSTACGETRTTVDYETTVTTECDVAGVAAVGCTAVDYSFGGTGAGNHTCTATAGETTVASCHDEHRSGFGHESWREDCVVAGVQLFADEEDGFPD